MKISRFKVYPNKVSGKFFNLCEITGTPFLKARRIWAQLAKIYKRLYVADKMIRF